MDNPEFSSQSEAATVMDKGKQLIQREIVLEMGEPSRSSPIENPVPCLGSDEDELQANDHITRSVHLQLYQAAIIGDWNAAKRIIDKRTNIVREQITRASETSLHIAVAAKHEGFVKNLLIEMKSDGLQLENKESNTALHIAAAIGAVEIAKMLVDADKTLTIIPNRKDMFPIHVAALFRRGKMVEYLYKKTELIKLSGRKFINLFHAVIEADIYGVFADVALRMFQSQMNKEALSLYQNDNTGTALHLMARKPSAISKKSQLNLFQKLAYFLSKGFFYHEPKMQTLAHQLVEELWKSVVHLPEERIKSLVVSPTNLLFDAAKMGNVNFLVILIRSYPDISWIADDTGRSLFHIAAVNRHRSIFKLIHKIGGIKDLIASYKEEKTKNNFLHLVARLPPPNRPHNVPGAALQMQREILWFEAVQEIVPHSYINAQNSKRLLPHDIFTKEHKSLCREGEKWMKDTATACMLVATLVATVVFAAAFTVPGGYDESTERKYNNLAGFPRFRKRFWFDVFVFSDSVSLLSSVTAVVFFLSILTSRYTEDDFRAALPTKLMFGFLALFVSIISMILAFTTTMILTRDQEHEWSLILIICFDFLTAISFIWLHFTLWFDTLRSAYVTKFLSYGSKSGLFLKIQS